MSSSPGSLDSIGWDPKQQVVMVTATIFTSVLWMSGNFLLAIVVTLILILPLPWVLVYCPRLQRKLLFHSWYYKADKSLDSPELWGVKGGVNRPIGCLGCWFIPSTCMCAAQNSTCTCRCDTVVVYCHGSSGSRGNSYRVDLVNYLASLGCAVYTFDYRGYADSPGESSQINSIVDTKEVVAFAREQHPGKRIVLYGHSMGTGVVCQTASQLLQEKREVDAVILEAPFLSIPDVILMTPLLRFVNSLSIYKDFLWNFSDLFSSKDVIGELSNVLILFAENDEVIPPSHAEELHSLCEGSKLHLISEGGHNFLINQNSVKAAISEHLKRK